MGLFGHMRIHESGIDHNSDTPTTSTMPSLTVVPSPAPITTTTTTASSLPDADTVILSCRHCPRTFTSRIRLVGHLRIHRTGEPAPGAPTYTHRTCLHCPHCPRTFTHRMGLFGHMHIHESGIDHNSDTPTTSNTPTMPSPTIAPSPCAPITITTTTTASSAADTDIAIFSCPHCPRTFTARIYLVVTNESISQRLKNQCLEHQPIPTKLDSTAHTVLALSGIAWTYSATCAFTTTCGRQPPATPYHNTRPASTTTPYINTHPPQVPSCRPPRKWEVCISTRSPCGSSCTGDLSQRLSLNVKRRG
nr:unnamed protein product [Spirometra erinaceieuropaei]